MVYLDHNATTPLDGQVLEAMMPFLGPFYGNPSALYRLGRLARTAIDTAREQIAALVEAQPSQVVFTSGGTEANNLAFRACAPLSAIAISAIEHPSVTEPALRLKAHGCQVFELGVDAEGLVAQAGVAEVLAAKVEFVSIMLANNETGAIQDVGWFARQLTGCGICVHTDAVQGVGKIPVSFRELGVQMLSLSSHKLYGPKGCGALVIDQNDRTTPLLLGGGQERGLRAGTENVAAIVGFGKAAELAHAGLAERTAHLLKLRHLLENSLKTIKGLVIFAEHSPRLPNTVQFGIDGYDGEMLLMRLDQKGIALSSGSACAANSAHPSPVLAAMKVEPRLARSALRISLGQTNTQTDIITFAQTLKALLDKTP